MTTSGARDERTPLGVGLLGLGNVGSAVAETLLRGRDGPAEAAGVPVELRGAVVRDISKRRSVSLPPGVLSVDPAHVLDDSAVAIVVEVMGGEEPAFDYISRALRAGKHVVTANKEVLSKRGGELLSIAAEHGVSLAYEASVGGGIPIVGPLSDDLLANSIVSIRAIINGTTNYILTRMAADGADFGDALAEAQALGYAEADPTADVDAFDAMYKITILARLAFRTEVPIEAVYREGIRDLKARDFRYARDLGYTIKLLAVARREQGGLLSRVHPALVPANVPMASVNGVLNAVEVEGDLVGTLWFQGPGAGPQPTASAIMGDLIRIARKIGAGSAPAPARAVADGLRLLGMEEHVSQYCMRLGVKDRAGVLAKIAGVLGDLDISIASVIQKDVDLDRGVADLVIMTHPAREANIQMAVTRIKALDVVVSLANLLRVEGYDSVG